MDPTTRFALGLSILLAFQVLLSGTVVFLVRRRNRVEPRWSWPRSIGALALLGLLANAVGLVPVVGLFAAVIVWLIGLKRMSGLDTLSTFILAFVMGILFFAVSAVISTQLQVDVLGLRR